MINKIKRHYKLLKLYSKLLRKISGKNSIFDMVLSRIFLHVPYTCYIDFGFYNKSWKSRKDYIYQNNDFVFFERYNTKDALENYADKRELILKTKSYMKRKIVVTTNLPFDDFKQFTNSLSSFFYKPADGCSGDGIKKIFLSDKVPLVDIYNEIKSLPDGILEETVKQHEDLNKLCPGLLQTIRFTVFLHKNGPRILFASLKSSVDKNSIVDNAHGGGIFANINLETGRIQTNAFRSFSKFEDVEKYGTDLFSDEGLACHPITGTAFKGFKIPCFDEAKQMVLDMSNNVDYGNRRLIGYDIAISDHGPLLIEANINRPGISNVWQTARKDVPLKPIIEEMFKE